MIGGSARWLIILSSQWCGHNILGDNYSQSDLGIDVVAQERIIPGFGIKSCRVISFIWIVHEMAKLSVLFILFLSLHFHSYLCSELMFVLDANDELCFYEFVKEGEETLIEYQVNG